MVPSEHYDDSGLPPIQVTSSTRMTPSELGSIFGGQAVERRPLMLILAVWIIILIGFIMGTLFTIGVLTGLIEIDPKAIKSVLKAIVGKG